MNKTLLRNSLFLSLLVFCLFFTSCDLAEDLGLVNTQESSDQATKSPSDGKESTTVSISSLPEYYGEPYVVIDENQPGFTNKDKTRKSFEKYSKLDSLGRCGVAYANVGLDLMPTEERSSIGKIKPSGWHTVKYDSVDGKYLYNRCHLIGYQLTAENVNERNLITGTRYMNVDGMLPFENMVADYIQETGNHVLYRVTPIFKGDNLLAKGVQMEAYSVEDDGDGICFNVFVYNVQPGIYINYATGDSYEDNNQNTDETDQKVEQVEIRGNKKSKIYHCPGQAFYDRMADSDNLVIFHSEQEALDAGYQKAKR